MSAITHLAIECPTAPVHTSIPISSSSPEASPIISNQETEGDACCYLWKGICRFFTGIFKSRERMGLEEKNRMLEEENQLLEENSRVLEEKNQILEEKSKKLEEEAIIMKVKLTEVSEMEKKTKKWLENEVDRGTEGIKAMLQSQTNELHEKRMSELEVFKEMFERHEEVSHDYLSYKQGYEELTEAYEEAQQRIKELTERESRLHSVSPEGFP